MGLDFVNRKWHITFHIQHDLLLTQTYNWKRPIHSFGPSRYTSTLHPGSMGLFAALRTLQVNEVRNLFSAITLIISSFAVAIALILSL